MSRETANSERDRYRRILSEYATRVSWDDLPAETVHEVKRRTLDSIGVAIAAYDDDAPSAARVVRLGADASRRGDPVGTRRQGRA